jgi:hypothetical protein
MKLPPSNHTSNFGRVRKVRAQGRHLGPSYPTGKRKKTAGAFWSADPARGDRGFTRTGRIIHAMRGRHRRAKLKRSNTADQN